MLTEESGRKAWHRIFGVVLTDLPTGTPFNVELEKRPVDQTTIPWM